VGELVALGLLYPGFPCSGGTSSHGVMPACSRAPSALGSSRRAPHSQAPSGPVMPRRAVSRPCLAEEGTPAGENSRGRSRGCPPRAGRTPVPGAVDAVARRRCVGGGMRSSGPYRRPCGCHGRRLGARLMTIRLSALARHLPVRLGHQLLE